MPSILIDALVLSVFLYGGVFLMIKINPRSQLHNYPPEIAKTVPPQSKEERKIMFTVGLPVFCLIVGYIMFASRLRFSGPDIAYWQALVHWVSVHLVTSAIDLFVCDYWIFCSITPKFVVIPGTEGNSAYKDKACHTKTIPSMLLISMVLGAVSSLTYFLL